MNSRRRIVDPQQTAYHSVLMSSDPSAQPPDPAEPFKRLAQEGLVRLPTRTLADFLAARGALEGPVTDAGTRALQEQRGDRV